MCGFRVCPDSSAAPLLLLGSLKVEHVKQTEASDKAKACCSFSDSLPQRLSISRVTEAARALWRWDETHFAASRASTLSRDDLASLSSLGKRLIILTQIILQIVFQVNE